MKRIAIALFAVVMGAGLMVQDAEAAKRLGGGKSAGAIRVSLGLASNFADVERFLQFAAGFRDQATLAVGAVSFDIESCRVIRDGS